MKINKKLYKYLPTLTLLPLVFAIIYWKNVGNIFLANVITNNLVTNIILSSLFVYGINMLYRSIYSKNEQKKLVAPLSFLFITTLLTLFIFIIGTTVLLTEIGVNISSYLAASFSISIVLTIINTLYFEDLIYTQGGTKEIRSFLSEVQSKSFGFEVCSHLFIILIIIIMGVNDTTIISNYGLIGILLTWNLGYSRIIRPQIFNFLKNE